MLVAFVIMVILPLAAFIFLASGIIHYLMEERRRERETDYKYLEVLIERQTQALLRELEEDD
jgi:hypothetical protein